MSTVRDHLNGLPIVEMPPAEGVRLGGEAAEGHAESVPQPPPPPPPPPAPTAPVAEQAPAPRKGRQGKTIGAAFRGLPIRYQVVGCSVAVVAATIGFTRMFVKPVDEASIARSAAREAVAATQQQINTAKAQATQVAVPSPFSWAACPLTNEAMGLIGGDPATGGKTLSPERAAPLEQEAIALLVGFRLPDLRLVSPAPGALKVVAGGTQGVALLNCIPNNTATPAVTPTSVAQ